MYAVVDPGEFIEMQYSALPVPHGKKRTFIFVTHGRYFTLSDSVGIPAAPPVLSNQTNVTEFSIGTNYPNPFNPLTKIDFQLPVDGYTTLVVYDMLGREVAKLVDRALSKGYHSVTWDASGKASGIYFCRYEVANQAGKVLFTAVRKMLLMR